jgi:hypothetical protein
LVVAAQGQSFQAEILRQMQEKQEKAKRKRQLKSRYRYAHGHLCMPWKNQALAGVYLPICRRGSPCSFRCSACGHACSWLASKGIDVARCMTVWPRLVAPQLPAPLAMAPPPLPNEWRLCRREDDEDDQADSDDGGQQQQQQQPPTRGEGDESDDPDSRHRRQALAKRRQQRKPSGM